MTLVSDITSELRSIGEAELKRAIADAHVPSLLVTLAFITGNWSILDEEFRPSTKSVSLGMDPTGGLSAETLARAKEVALSALLDFRESGFKLAPEPNEEELVRLMQFITGPVDEDYVPMMKHELGIPSAGAPTWTKDDLAPEREFTVAVIGAGMSGIVAAHRLSQAGIPFEIFERNSDVGGVWLKNDYPGARLDTSNFTYSYSFAQDGSWKDNYSEQREVLAYLQRIASEYGIRDHVRFETKVEAATFNRQSSRWDLTVRSSSGEAESMVFDAVISSVGQLSEPSIPAIPGLENFAGESWHTAEWNHNQDLTGKRVAIIGSGASAFQVIPHAANSASSLTIFQRTPSWVLPTAGYTGRVPDGLHWALKNIPYYHRFYRFTQFWLNVDGIRYLALVDPEWEHPVSVSEDNERVRASLEKFLRESFPTRPDLQEKLLPNYPPYAKRTVRDDGTWTAAMQRDNVQLVTEGISRITQEGIETVDGVLHEVDVIVFGTGFAASEFLSSFEVRGRDGRSLSEYWDGDPRAFYGVYIPNYPNLFCIYGPNSNLNVNGSIVLFSECGVDFALAGIRKLLESGHRTIEVRADAHDRYNDVIDAATKTLAVGVSTVNTWYKNKYGRVSQNWPLTTLDYWKGTRDVSDSDFIYAGVAEQNSSGVSTTRVEGIQK